MAEQAAAMAKELSAAQQEASTAQRKNEGLTLQLREAQDSNQALEVCYQLIALVYLWPALTHSPYLFTRIE